MDAKYNMTVEQNIFVAKRNIIDYIWKSAKLEGIAVTFPETEAIYNGYSVPYKSVDDIVAINNLKHAWRFILDTIDYPMDFPMICQINRYVGAGLYYNNGLIRNTPVRIGGTTWRPDLPIESVIKEEIADILSIPSVTERAIMLMLYLMRKQTFIDGNKHTSMLAANHVLISGGEGIITVPIELQSDFTYLLIDFYEKNEIDNIKDFVYRNCIDGMEFID